MNYLYRTLRLVFGLFLCGAASYCSIRANIGLAPWEAFAMGFSNITGISFGNMFVLNALVIIGIDYLLKEKIGFGTVANAVLMGKTVDLLQYLDVLPLQTNFFAGVGVLFVGQILMGLGCYFYIGAAMGCGPRDALMVALMKRFNKRPLWQVRLALEGSALTIGALLGAKVGLGTLISAIGVGFVIQMVFKVLNFNVKEVKHEDFSDTIKNTLHKSSA